MPADVKQLFDSGQLSAAIAAQTEEVKATSRRRRPASISFRAARVFRPVGARDQAARGAAHQDIETEMAAQVYINLLHAEGLRRKLYTDGLKPEFLLDPPAYVQLHLQAIDRLRESKPRERKSYSINPKTSGLNRAARSATLPSRSSAIATTCWLRCWS